MWYQKQKMIFSWNCALKTTFLEVFIIAVVTFRRNIMTNFWTYVRVGRLVGWVSDFTFSSLFYREMRLSDITTNFFWDQQNTVNIQENSWKLTWKSGQIFLEHGLQSIETSQLLLLLLLMQTTMIIFFHAIFLFAETCKYLLQPISRYFRNYFGQR